MASRTILLLNICLLSVLLCNTVTADKCSPSPCGPNTNCQLSAKGVPICSCKETYYGDDPIKAGCKRECEKTENCNGSKKCFEYQCVECTEHSDCTNSAKNTCFANHCVDICKEVKCGQGASCRTTPTNEALCFCPPGKSGNALKKCS